MYRYYKVNHVKSIRKQYSHCYLITHIINHSNIDMTQITDKQYIFSKICNLFVSFKLSHL